MPLTEKQVQAVQDAVRMVEDTDDGCGEVRIVIKNHHPHLIQPAPSLRMPLPAPAFMTRDMPEDQVILATSKNNAVKLNNVKEK